MLHPNYPNPFNPSTTLSFSLRTSHLARLAIYDVLGREVAVLVDDVMPAGSHSVTFEAGNLATGIYLVRLEAGGMVRSRNITLIK